MKLLRVSRFLERSDTTASTRSIAEFGKKSMALACLALGLLASGYATGPEPSLSYAYPAGARTGSIARIVLAGQNLKDIKLVQVSGQGVSARVRKQIGGNGPLDKIEKESLKDYLKARGKKDADKNPPAVPALPDLPELADLATKSAEQLRVLHALFLDNSRMAKPPMDELVVLELQVAENALPGAREIRIVNSLGISNPLVFQIGALQEFTEAGPYEIPDEGRRVFSALPAVGNGQVMPGEVDSWKLVLRKGQQILVSCQARNLIPYIADDWGSDPDPLIRITAPEDGSYSLEVRDSIYRGRYDFVYRLVVGDGAALSKQLPQLSSIGRSVSGLSGFENKPAAGPGMLIPKQPVGGTIAKPGEVDSYRFQAAAGETVCVRIKARIQGSPLDALLRVVDSTGSVLAANDDFEDKSLGLYAHHADPQLRVSFRQAGIYQVQVSDSSRLAGDDYRYELLIEPPVPDFTVLTRRSALPVAAGGSAALWVQVVRRDGWDGEVELFLEDGKGLSLSGARIPAGRDSLQLTVDADSKPGPGLSDMRLMARADIGGRTVVRPVQAADMRMQAFGNTHLVPAEKLQVLVLKAPADGLSRRSILYNGEAIAKGEALVLEPGSTFTLSVNLKLQADQQVKAQLLEPPPGLTMQEQRLTPNGLDIVLAVDEKLPLRDNLILDFTLVIAKPDGKPLSLALGTLPAIPFRRGP